MIERETESDKLRTSQAPPGTFSRCTYITRRSTELIGDHAAPAMPKPAFGALKALGWMERRQPGR